MEIINFLEILFLFFVYSLVIVPSFQQPTASFLPFFVIVSFVLKATHTTLDPTNARSSIILCAILLFLYFIFSTAYFFSLFKYFIFNSSSKIVIISASGEFFVSCEFNIGWFLSICLQLYQYLKKKLLCVIFEETLNYFPEYDARQIFSIFFSLILEIPFNFQLK